MAFNFLERNYLDVVAGSSALSYNDISSARIDTQTVGCDAITFIAYIGASVETGAVLTLQAWEHTADAASGTQIDADTVTYTAAASDAEEKLLVLTVRKDALTKRYVWAKLVVATAQASVGGIFAICHDLRRLPCTQSADVLDHDTVET